MYDIVCSLVIYKNAKKQLLDAINSFLFTELNVKLVLIDNSPDNELKDIKIDKRIEYIFNPSNPGFGTSHNIAIKKYNKYTKYHLILNPDIYYETGVLEDIVKFMDKDKKIGLLMPKILYPDGSIQYLAKLIPSPIDFFVRRLLPNSTLKSKFISKFELRFSGYDQIMEVPYLSGCFMVFSSNALKELDGFDEGIFMHMEDLDISRRCAIHGFKSIFYPYQVVYHDHLFKSVINLTNLKIYLTSAIYYFNKWGWLIDKDRIITNKKTLLKIKKKYNFI